MESGKLLVRAKAKIQTHYRVIKLKQGRLTGKNMKSWYSGQHYYSFLGVPYAKPPLGELRFKPPEPHPGWTGTLNANADKDCCIQRNPFTDTTFGSEDCLYMNIHIPEWPSKDQPLKSVMVLVHGGGNYFGSGNTSCGGSPDFAIHHDIIYITFNYRLHVLGYLNLGLPECPGNVALRDIIMVFRWIRENIDCFGGDSNNVTAIGSSSSAALIHYLLLSPNINGLFDKAIFLGGYAVNPVMTYDPHGIAIAFEYGKCFKYNGKSGKALLKILMEKTANELLDAVSELTNLDRKKQAGCYSPRSPFLPTVESIKEGAVLPVSPRELLDQVECIPMITGICSKEGMYMFMANPMPELRRSFKSVVRRLCWQHKLDYRTLNEITKEIREFYFKDQEISFKNLPAVMDFYTGACYAEYYETTLESMLKNCPSVPVYNYEFHYDGELNFLKRFIEKLFDTPVEGACHNDEFFYWGSFEERTLTERDKRTVDCWAKLWTNFAKYGDPNDKTFPFDWKPFTLDKPCFLRIDDEIKIINGTINGGGLKFWRNMIEKVKKRSEAKNTGK